MKKSLLALAVLGAFAGVASAQSSVTLFGVVDVAGRYVSNGAGKQYQLAQDGIASSRIGFRGTEDLGGGLTASFWLEGGINPDTGTIGVTGINGGANNAAQLFQRRSTASLAGGWGELRLGRDYTATFWNATIFDPFGTNGVGSSGNLYLVVPGVPTGGGYGTLVRDNNIIGYFLPSGIAGGLYGQLQYGLGENVPGQRYWGGRLGYAAGPFNVAGAYGVTQVTNNVDGRNYNFGGSWNFSFMTLSAYYGRLNISDASQNNWYIGAVAPMGLWNFKGSYGQVNRTGHIGALNVDGQKANQFALGADYNLSKRTALYGTYSYLNNSSGAAFTVAPLINWAAGGAQANANSQGFEVGIKHSF
jgi:predicted porin